MHILLFLRKSNSNILGILIPIIYTITYSPLRNLHTKVTNVRIHS